MSDSTRRRDLGGKRDAYVRRRKIPEYWIIDPDERNVLTWRPGRVEAEIVSGTLRWQPLPGISALEMDLESLLPPRP